MGVFLIRLREAGPEFDPANPLPNCATARAFEAESEDEVRAIWARDPWHGTHLILESVEPWTIRLRSHELHLK